MSLLQKLQAGKRNVRRVKFPGTEVEIGITVLTESEMQEAVFEAERLFKKCGIEVSATTLGTYEKELSTQTLFRAIVDPGQPKPDGSCARLFGKIEDLKALFTAPKIKDELIVEYNSLEEECNPSPNLLSEPELMAIFETVKKKPDGRISLSSSTQRQLIVFMASLLSASPKDSGAISTL